MFVFMCILYFLFMSFIALSAYDGVDLVDITELYKNDVILSIVQISNLLLKIGIDVRKKLFINHL